MQIKSLLKLLGAPIISAALVSCGGGSGSALDNLNNGGTGSSSSVTGAIGTTWKIGSGSGSSFSEGALVQSIDDGSLLYMDGTVKISVSVVTKTDVLITDPLSITFSSPCLTSGAASITGGVKQSTSTGSLAVSYKPTSCFGSDTVTATLDFNGKKASATTTVVVQNKRLGIGSSVDFVPTKLDLGSNFAALFGGQTTILSVNIVNDAGNLVQPVSAVTFSSPCLDGGFSSITGGKTINSTAGVVRAEYKAGTCFGDDLVTASITYGGKIVSAQGTIPQINNKRIGIGFGSNFVLGQMSSSNTVTLFEGDTTQLTVNIVDNQGNPVGQSTQVVFDSPCISLGKSSVVGGNVVNSINGVAKATYKVGKCAAEERVTATITNGTSPLEAVAELAIDSRQMGAGFGTDFSLGQLELGIGSGMLSPGGSTTVTAYLVNSKGDLVTDSLAVTFSSPCLSAETSSITGGNTVTAVNGKAVAVYSSKGCIGVGGYDYVKASAPFRNAVLQAEAYVAIKADSAQTIKFDSAEPKLISIKGTGGTETSKLKFQVLGQSGTPLRGVCVSFKLSTEIGGLSMVKSTCNPAGGGDYEATTDADGYASVIVQAGTIPTPVRVLATAANGVSTQSSLLTITTGIADQNSMSISRSVPVTNSWSTDGVESVVNVLLADAFNNPVPDGTAVNFTASGGAIAGSCATANGACSATWRSQLPRPEKFPKVGEAGGAYFELDVDGFYRVKCPSISDIAGNSVNECRNGRVQVLASAIGNESFIDGNGNGLYDDKSVDIFITHSASNSADPYANVCQSNMPKSTASVGVTKGCDDLPEAYLDSNFNGVRTGDEEFVDFNKNGSYQGGNGKYDGVLCSGAAKLNGDCTTNTVSVRGETLIVMGSSNLYSLFNTGLPSSISIALGSNLYYKITVADLNGNGLPAGATIAADVSGAEGVTVSFDVPDVSALSTSEPKAVVMTVKADAAKAPKGSIVVKVTVGGLITSYTVPVSVAP